MRKFADWRVQPEAEDLLRIVLDTAISDSKEAALFSQNLLKNCGVRLRDIIDHIVFSDTASITNLENANWEKIADGVWRNSTGYFPDFVKGEKLAITFRCEAVDHFLAVHNIAAPIEGKAFGPLRRALVFKSPGADFYAIERNGYENYDVPDISSALIRQAQIHFQAFKARRREFTDPGQGLNYTIGLVEEAVQDLGQHWACDIFLRAERIYWMRGCVAGRQQKSRQDSVGIGWANIDHHTYDSSREWFPETIKILETIGFQCRELFYAGHQAGWGSQVLEQPVLRHTIFADIDLSPEELEIDFAHIKLAPLSKHRRAGLLCAMHGQSMLNGGLNHVAGMYDNKKLRKQLETEGFQFMAPFSDFPHLYQELTNGDWRPVNPKTIDALEAAGHITTQEAEDFRLNGTIATHLENLERNDGYKGFNQPGIDSVLRKIDPRKNIGNASS